jgi:acyl-CoA synthetase (AMP-forming)/AMP-acid ligase II
MGSDAAVAAEPSVDAGWVDDVLLAGRDDEVCLHLGRPIGRGALRREVADRERALRAAGIVRGGAVVLRLPPSLAYVANLLAAWRIGARVALLDHRLTPYEAGKACERLRPTARTRSSSLAPVRPDRPK